MRHFVVSADQGNLSKASKELGIAQPALSQSISKLETSLNAALLQRSQKGVVLTEAGQLFLPKIINILNNLSEAEESIQSYINEPSGKVKIF